MTATKSVKLIINSKGHTSLTHPTAKRGYGGSCPIVEIVDVPWHVNAEIVQRTFDRVAIVKPVMFCDRPIPWSKIEGAEQGQIVRLD